MQTHRSDSRTTAEAMFALLALAGPVAAQDQVLWQAIHDVPGVNTIVPQRIVPTPDGGAVAIGVTEPGTAAMDTIAVRLTENGDVLWHVTVPKGLPTWFVPVNHGADGAVDRDGNLYLAVEAEPADLLSKYGPSGNLLWSQALTSAPGADWVVARVVLDAAGQPIVGGTTTTSAGGAPVIELQKFDRNGAPLWREASAIGVLRGLERASSGDVVVHGRAELFSWGAVGLLVRYTDGGTLLWRRTISTSPYIQWDWSSYWYNPVEDQAFDAAGNHYTIVNGHQGIHPNLNPESFVVASHTPGGAARYSTEIVGAQNITAQAVAADALGNAYVVGRSTGTPNGSLSLRVWCFGPAGNLVWSRGLPATDGRVSHGLGVQVEVDGNVLVQGSLAAPNEAGIDASLTPSGTLRWSRLRPGSPPTSNWHLDADIAADVRGNRFVLGAGSNTTGFDLTVVKVAGGGAVGSSECAPAVANSTGAPAELRALGSDAAARNNVTLRVSGVPAATSVLFLAGRAAGSTPGVGGGQGTLCMSGPIGRFVAPGQVRSANAAGQAALQVHLDVLPQPTGLVSASAGETWRFQAWYRDQNPQATSNLSNGVALTLQ